VPVLCATAAHGLPRRRRCDAVMDEDSVRHDTAFTAEAVRSPLESSDALHRRAGDGCTGERQGEKMHPSIFWGGGEGERSAARTYLPLMRKEVGSGVLRHSMKASHSSSGTIFCAL